MGPDVVFGVVLTTFFFALPMGLAFPLSGGFLCCLVEEVLIIGTLGEVLLLVTMVGFEFVAGVLVVVATTACKSLYLQNRFSLNLSVCLIQHTDFS